MAEDKTPDPQKSTASLNIGRSGELGGEFPESQLPQLPHAAISGDLVAGAAASQPSPAALVQPALKPDQVLAGRFRIVRFIARGGMGEVYEAEDRELGERVALKTIRPEIAADDHAMQRFRREIHLARKVTHPNVCRIYDLSFDRGIQGRSDITFLTMELLEGQSLADLVHQRGRLSTDESMGMVRQISAALAAAHAAGVIHRDLKSSNVVLVPSKSGDGQRAVVTDFGLARSETGGSGVSLTGAEAMVGTPAYMAPEQIEDGAITAATDLYALGIVMFEMVTGRLPFTGATRVSVALKRLREPAPSPRGIVPDLSTTWEQVILRCLERDAAMRFQSAADVVSALEGHTVAQPRAPRKLPAVAITAAVLALVVAASSIAGYRWLSRRGPSAQAPAATVQARPAVAVLGFKNLSGRADAAWLSTALSEMLNTELAAGERLRTISGGDVARARGELGIADADSLPSDAVAKLRSNLGADLAVTGSYVTLGEGPQGQLRLDLRLVDLKRGDTVASIAETGSAAKLFELVSRTGAQLRQRLGVGDVSETEAAGVLASLPANPEAARLYSEGLRKLRSFDALSARDLLQKAVGIEPRHAFSWAALSDAWSVLGYDNKAQQTGKKAFDLAAGLSRENTLAIEGRYRETTHEWDKAAALYRSLFTFFPDNLEYGLKLASAQTFAGKGSDALQTVAALRKLPPPMRDDPRIDLAQANAADSLSDLKQELEAATRAVSAARANGAGLLAAQALWKQCWAYRNLGDSGKAFEACSQARSLFEAAGDKLGVARALTNLGNIEADRGDVAAARRDYEQALQNARAVGAQMDVSGALTNLGNFMADHGDLAGARKNYEQALSVSREIGDKSGILLLQTNLGTLLYSSGDYSGAKDLFEQARQVADDIGDKGGLARAFNNLGQVWVALGDLAQASKAYDQALALRREIGFKQGIALCLNNLGDVAVWRADFAAAEKSYSQGMQVETELNSASGMASSRLGMAGVYLEQGDLERADAAARQALSQFISDKDADSELAARVMLARIALGRGNASAAQQEVDSAERLSSQDQSGRLALRIAAAQVRARLGDSAAARRDLDRVISDARRMRSATFELDARLAAAEIELASNKQRGRSQLEDVRKEATSRGFLLIARKAARSLENEKADANVGFSGQSISSLQRDTAAHQPA